MKAFITVVVLLLVSVSESAAQTDIFIRGSGRLFPIAVPQLCLQAGDTAANKDIPKTIGRDLDLSGLFEIIEPGTYVETPGKCGGPESIAWTDWSIIGAEGLVKGTVTFDGAKLRAQLFLYDVARQKVVIGKEYEGELTQASKIAHKFANEIMRAFTGEPGVFGTQILFSSKVGRFKELFVMDMDGNNIRQLTSDRALAMSSSWDPTGRSALFTSYRQRVPDLFRTDLATRQITQITRGGELELGARFAKDGRSMILAQTVNGDSDIVMMDLSGRVIRKLTSKNGAIDVSPSFSPDESRVVFCSNRAGGPQIYTMNADGSGVKRISFVTSNYCTSPRWSPKGDKIAFVCRAEGGIQRVYLRSGRARRSAAHECGQQRRTGLVAGRPLLGLRNDVWQRLQLESCADEGGRRQYSTVDPKQNRRLGTSLGTCDRLNLWERLFNLASSGFVQ